MPPITKLRSLQINPGNLWVGDGDPDTSMAGGDVHIEGTLEVDGAFNMDGALALGNTLTVGEDGTGYDVQFFGDTSDSYMLWDADTDKLTLAYSKATIGLAAGATGVALSGTDPDQVFQVHGYISAAVAAGAYAGAYVTNTVTATQTNNASIFGTWSELYVTGGTVSLKSNHAAVWGNLEISGTVTMPGGVAWHGGVVGTVISPSTLTVSAGGILAGLVADSQVTAGHTATGAYVCGLAVRAGTSKPWPLGIYIADSAATTGIDIGSCTTGIDLTGTIATGISIDSGTTLGIDSAAKVRIGAAQGATGIALSGTDPDHALQVHSAIIAEDVTAGAYAGTWSTMSISEDQDEDVSAFGVWSELWLNAVDLTGASNFGALWGNVIVSATSTSSTGNLAGVMSSVNGPEAFTNNGRIVGVTVDSELHASMTNSGHIAGYDVRKGSGKFPWTYGLYITASAADTGIYIGTCATNAIKIVNTQPTTALPTIDSQSTFSATSGYHVGAQFYGDLTGVGTGSVYALRGHADNSATQTDQSTAQYIIGVHGRVINSGTCYSSGAIMAGVLGQVLDGGTYTAVSMLNAIWADWQNTATVTAGTKNMVYITNNANQVVDNAFYIKAGIGSGTISNLFSLNTLEVNDGMVRYQNVYTTHGGTYRNIRILINDTVYWMIVSDTPTS